MQLMVQLGHSLSFFSSSCSSHPQLQIRQVSSISSPYSRRYNSSTNKSRKRPGRIATVRIATRIFYQSKNQNENDETNSNDRNINTDNNDNNKNNDDDDDDDSWELNEDWTLQDQVPRFTVRSTQSEGEAVVVTFWTQLKHYIPELSSKTEKELEERYRTLCRRNIAEKEKERLNKNDSDEYYNNKGIDNVSCGPSPPLLSNWWVEDMSINTDNDAYTTASRKKSTIMMGGSLINGSRVWFPLQCAGNLAGDPFRNDDFFALSTSTSFSNYLGGTLGYAEANSGRIYELGSPHEKMTIMNESRDREGDRISIGGQRTAPFNNNGLNTIQENNTTKWILGLVTASVVSAYVAFGLGSGMTAASFLSNPSIADTVSNRQSETVKIVQVTPSTSPSSTGSSSSSSSNNSGKGTAIISAGATDVSELSIAGQRAKQELKVERDKMGIIRLEEKLQRDEAKLSELRKEENIQGTVNSGL